MATSTWAVFVDTMPRNPSPALLHLFHEANPHLSEGEVQALLSERTPRIAAGLSREQANALMTQLLAINVPARKQEVFNFQIKDEPNRASPGESNASNPTAVFTAPRGGSREA